MIRTPTSTVTPTVDQTNSVRSPIAPGKGAVALEGGNDNAYLDFAGPFYVDFSFSPSSVTYSNVRVETLDGDVRNIRYYQGQGVFPLVVRKLFATGTNLQGGHFVVIRP